MSHINFICEIAHAYQHMPAYFHYITQNHAYLPTHTRTWVPMMAQWPPLMRGHPFWEATFTQHLGWLLVRGFTVRPFFKRAYKKSRKLFRGRDLILMKLKPHVSLAGSSTNSPFRVVLSTRGPKIAQTWQKSIGVKALTIWVCIKSEASI